MNYVFKTAIRVYDTAALMVAAKERATEDGMTEDEWMEYSENETCVQSAIVMLIDPGMSPPGTEILFSTADKEMSIT